MRKKLLVLMICILAATLRWYNYLGRTVYGWDQLRDLKVLETTRVDRTLPLLGPIVRGDIGGFYLGPWYHYLLLPGYLVSGGNPHTLVWTSLTLDIIVVAILGLAVNIQSALIWACSPMLINSALTPWNVSLMHLWMLSLILLARSLQRAPSWPRLALYYGLLSLATSVHLTLWPVAGLAAILGIGWVWEVVKTRPLRLLPIIALALLPLIPLVLSDLMTHGANLRAFKMFLLITRNTPHAAWSAFLPIFWQKLGATVSRVFIAEPYMWLGLSLLGMILIWFGREAHRSRDARFLLLISVTVLGSILVYRDPDFAEYYLNGLLIPLIIAGGTMIASSIRSGSYLLLALMLALALPKLDVKDNPYSLAVRAKLMRQVSQVVGQDAGLILELPEYQQFGFAYYLHKAGVRVTDASHYRIVVAPAATEHISAPSVAPSIIDQTSLAAFRVVVFSN
jgi:hypothetical protein